MKNKYFIFLVIVSIGIMCGITTLLITNYNRVTQTVEHGWFVKTEIDTIFFQRNLDMSIDSSSYYISQDKKFCEYRLITSYKGYNKIVIGDYNDIQNIKCNEAKNIIKEETIQDSIEIAKGIFEEAEEKRQEKLLEELNKPCE